MKTLDIKKTPSGQYTYVIVDAFHGPSIPVQFGTYDAATTIQQARERFYFDSVRDMTQCKVSVINRTGGVETVFMTKDCYDRSMSRSTGYSSDQFLGAITEMAGVSVEEDEEIPF